MAATKRKKSEGHDPSRKDRRRYIRYQVHQSSILCNGENLAEVFNISSGGIACKRLIAKQSSVKVVTDLELLNCDIGEYVQGLACRRVRTNDHVNDSEHLEVEAPDLFFEFYNLSERQKNELARFIQRSSHERAPKLVFFHQ